MKRIFGISELIVENGFYKIEVFYNKSRLWRYIIICSRIFPNEKISQLDGIGMYCEYDVYNYVIELSKKYGITYKHKLNQWYKMQQLK